MNHQTEEKMTSNGSTIRENIAIAAGKHQKASSGDGSSSNGGNVFDYYEIVKTIGEGSTCKLYAVRKKKYTAIYDDNDNSYKKNGAADTDGNDDAGTTTDDGEETLFALKEISKTQVDNDSKDDQNNKDNNNNNNNDIHVQEMRNEIDIIRRLDHPNIVKVYDVFESKRAIYLVMECLTGGDLYARVPYTEAQAAKIMTKLLSALTYLHKNKVVHRDLKMENIMFESTHIDAEPKVIDFGLSKRYIQPTKRYKMHCRVGTAYTMSPEVIKGEYTDKADLWAAGVIAFILLSSTLPFDGTSNKEIIKKIRNQEYDKNFEGTEWKNVSKQAKSFVSSLLVYDPIKRKSAPEALRATWLHKEFNLQDRRPDKEVMNATINSLLSSDKDSKFKKLAMQVVAHISTTPEIQELRDVFDQIDVNNSGSINYFEFKKALSSCKNYSNDDIKKLFKSVDVNGTGEINYSEFIAATLESRGVIEDERILEAFDKLDVNNSGYIAKEELCSILGKKCTAENCNQVVHDLIEEVDTTKDGKISYDEFLVLFRDKARESMGGASCCPR